MFPVAQHLHVADAGDFEHFIDAFLCVVGDDVHEFFGELVGFQDIVFVLPGVVGGVAYQLHLFMLLHGFGQGVDHVALAALDGVVADAGGIINGSQFAPEACFQPVGSFQVFYQVAHYDGFFVGEVHQLAEVAEFFIIGCHLVHAFAHAGYGEAGGFQGVDVSEKGAFRGVQVTGDFVQGIVGVAGQILHEAQ